MQTVKYFVIHCSDSPNNRVDKRNDTAGDIHRWHLEKGWSGIGYHFVIDENGGIANGRPIFPDTKTFWPGAHVKSHNHESIAICLIGRDYFYPEQLNSLRKQIDYLYTIWPEAALIGHYQLDRNKTCPNFSPKKWYDTGETLL